MRTALRAFGVTLVTVVGVLLLALVTTVASAAARTTALIMGGSGDPLTTDQDGIPFVREYTRKAVDNFASPSSSRPDMGIPGGPYNAVAVITPEQFNSGNPSDHSMTFDQSVAAGTKDLHTCITSAAQCVYNEDIGSQAPTEDDSFVAFGYSQSATIASFEKAALADQYAAGEGPDVSFILIANGNRPNGGYLARGPKGLTVPLGLSGGGVTFSGPTRTDTQYATVDIAIQYDGWADQPVNRYNLIAVANANAGQRLLHPYYADQSLDQSGIIDQGQYGDTRYLMVSTDILPLLHDVDNIPVIGHALADALDAPLRVLVESGYDRTTSPGKPTTWSLTPARDPLKTAVDFAVAIPTGWDNAVEDLNGTRPFGTQRPGPYGVGGPTVEYLNPSEKSSTSEKDTKLTTLRKSAVEADSGAGLVAESSASQTISGLRKDVRSALTGLTDHLAARNPGVPELRISTSDVRSVPVVAKPERPRHSLTPKSELAPVKVKPDVRKAVAKHGIDSAADSAVTVDALRKRAAETKASLKKQETAVKTAVTDAKKKPDSGAKTSSAKQGSGPKHALKGHGDRHAARSRSGG
jgi:PE-PPE domain